MSDALGYLVQFIVGFIIGSAVGWLVFVLPQRLRAQREAARTLESIERFRPGCPYPDCACHDVERP